MNALPNSAESFIGSLKSNATVSVVFPAHNEERTIERIVRNTIDSLLTPGLIDEVVVMDDRSTDGTAQVARASGAAVFSTEETLRQFGPSRGKGDAIWRSLAVTSGDIIVWCDADLEDFRPEIICSLITPLLVSDSVNLTKGYFHREGSETGMSGRVTELTARPLLEVFAPHLSEFREPLGGLFAGRRSVMESIPMESDYGIDLGILADVASRTGLASIAEVDLGVIEHHRRPLNELVGTAQQVTRTIVDRFGVGPTTPSVLSRGTRRPPLRSIQQRPTPAQDRALSVIG